MAFRTKLRIFCCLGVSSSVMGPPYLYLYTVLFNLTRRSCPTARHSTRAYNSRQHDETLRIRSHPNDSRDAPRKAANSPGAKKRSTYEVAQTARPLGDELYP